MRRAAGELLKFFSAHVYWLKRFPSLHSSANNHRIAELAGLIVGTTMAPGIARSGGSAREVAGAICSSKSTARFTRTGSVRSRRRAYTAFAIELFLVAALRLRKTARLAGGHEGSACGLGRALLVAHGHRRRRCRQSAIRTIAASSQRPRLASRDMLPRSSRRLRAALAALTLLHQGPIPAFVTCCSDRWSASSECSAQGCARFRQAVIR